MIFTKYLSEFTTRCNSPLCVPSGEVVWISLMVTLEPPLVATSCVVKVVPEGMATHAPLCMDGGRK